MKPQNGPDSTTILIGVGIFLLGILFVMRLYPPLAFAGFIIGSAVGFFLLGDRALKFIRGATGDQRAKHDEKEFAGRIAIRLLDCQEREEKFRDEGERIMKSIAALRDDLDRSSNVSEAELNKAQEVIKELEAEFSLRHAKAAFFSDCAKKLKELHDRYRLTESILARQRELRELRQTNFDDESVVEETRYGIEQDSIQLETIVELSQSAASSSKAEQAEALRERLEKLRHKTFYS